MSVYPVCSLIKEFRKRNGLTQAMLCENICDTSTLSRIETGQTLPTAQIAECLMQRLKAHQYFYIGNSTVEEIDFLKRQTRVLKDLENNDFETYHTYMNNMSDRDESKLGNYERQRHRFIVACYNERTGEVDVEEYINALQVTMPLDYVLSYGRKKLFFDQEILILLCIVRLFARDGDIICAKRICDRLYEFTQDDHYLYPVICHYITCLSHGTVDRMISEIVPRD